MPGTGVAAVETGVGTKAGVGIGGCVYVDGGGTGAEA